MHLSFSKVLVLGVLLVFVLAGSIYRHYGTLSACEIVRYRVRHAGAPFEQNYLHLAGLSDAYIDFTLDPNGLNTGRCVKILLKGGPEWSMDMSERLPREKFAKKADYDHSRVNANE